MATKRAWGAQDSRRVSLQPQIWNVLVQWLGCTHLILLCDRRPLVGSLMMCRQCWSWACSTRSTTGGITGKWSQKRWDWRKAQNQRTPCMLCHWKAYLWLLGCLSQSSSLSARWDFHQSSRLMCGPGTRPWLDQTRKSDVPEPPQLCNAIPAIRL